MSTEFNLYNKQPQSRLGKYVKFVVESFYGSGGGLQFLQIQGKNAPNSKQFLYHAQSFSNYK